MSGSAFFLQRMNDHVQYLKKIQATLDGKGDFPGTTHHECKLGEWLYSDGPNEAASVGDEARHVFDQLLAPHESFHSISHAALEKQSSGDAAGARQAITEMHKLSATLIDQLLLLDKLSNA